MDGVGGWVQCHTWMCVCNDQIVVTSMLPSCTSVLGVMEPLLPETAEGGDACARPNEDARQGGVLRELEATDTARRQKRGDLGLQTPQVGSTSR